MKTEILIRQQKNSLKIFIPNSKVPPTDFKAARSGHVKQIATDVELIFKQQTKSNKTNPREMTSKYFPVGKKSYNQEVG